jgi:hypothetical protein
MNPERKLKQDIYIRVCKDSGFMLSSTDAAILAAKVIGCHPLEIWIALDFDLMNRIASGEHPICKQEA